MVATVVGSGIMAESLTRDVALALLGNTLPTGAILVVLITILGPISGAHFNPAVSLVFALKRELTPRDALCYVAAQIAGGIAGTMMAHAMFALPLLDASLKVRTGGAQWFAEGVAAFGLIVTILGGIRFERAAVPWLVGLYITAAYWFTSSTSFANPAVAIARSLTNTFSGIRPVDLPGFIAAELCGAVAALTADGLAAARRSRGRRYRKQGAAMSVTIYHNPELRHLAQHAGHDPPERRGAGDHRISEKSAEPGAADRIDPGDGNSGARAAARKRHALRGTRAGRSQMERRRADRLHAGASDPDQPADRRDAEGHETVPAVGSGARSARPSRRLLREGGRRGRHAAAKS